MNKIEKLRRYSDAHSCCYVGENCKISIIGSGYYNTYYFESPYFTYCGVYTRLPQFKLTYGTNEIVLNDGCGKVAIYFGKHYAELGSITYVDETYDTPLYNALRED